MMIALILVRLIINQHLSYKATSCNVTYVAKNVRSHFELKQYNSIDDYHIT